MSPDEAVLDPGGDGAGLMLLSIVPVFGVFVYRRLTAMISLSDGEVKLLKLAKYGALPSRAAERTIFA